jgi:HAD superfamily hydrolase (TIGR01509 family)
VTDSGSGRPGGEGWAAIFDMDGTLVDSEPNYFDADRVFLKGYGIDYSEDVRDTMIGRGNFEFFRMLEDSHPDNPLSLLPMEERIRLKDENYLEYARGRTFAFPEMVKLLGLLAAEAVPMAVASGSSPDIIRHSLDFAGIGERFSVRVSALEVPRGKPEPDVFLEAARRLGIEPARCAVLEDSQYGVRAALAAGMRIVGVPSPVSGPMPEAFASVDLLFREGIRGFSAEGAFDAMAGWFRA